MNIFQAVAESLGFVSKKKATLGLAYETPNLSANATVSTIQTALRSAEAGDTKNLFALYRDLSVGGSHIHAEFNKRKLAVLSQPLAILPANGMPGVKQASREDMAAAAAVEQMLADCENWVDGLTHLLESGLWPVAVCEKIFRQVEPGERAAKLGLKFTLRRLEPVNAQLMCFRRPPIGFVKSEWEPDLRFYATDEEGRISYAWDQTYAADPVRHIIHRGHMLTGVRDCWGGPMRAIVFWWLLGGLARDWFGRGMERWGSPFPVGHTDAKNQEAITLLQEAFALSTKVGGLVVDHETQIELKEIASAGMADAYEKFLNVCNREISKVIVGQTLSADAQPTGLGSSVGKLQGEVRDDIRMMDCVKLAQTMTQQLFRQCLQINGLAGGVPRPVWGGLDDEDAKLLAETLATLKTAGWEPTDDAVPTLSDRLGFPIQKVEMETVLPGAGRNGETSKPETLKEEDKEKDAPEGLTAWVSPRVRGRLAVLSQQGKMADALGVPATWLNPLRSFLEDLQAKAADRSLSEQDLLEFLDQAVKRVPELFAEMDVDELAKVMEAGMGEAVLQEVRKQIRSPKSEGRNSN